MRKWRKEMPGHPDSPQAVKPGKPCEPSLEAQGPVVVGFESQSPAGTGSTGDLNLRDSRGVAVAYGRLVWAAERVCPFADSSDHYLRVSAARCVTQAVSRAVDSIGSPELSAYTQSQPLFRFPSHGLR